MTQELLKVDIQASRKAIGALDTPQLLYMLVDIRLPEQHALKRLPINLCLVIDRSTSMRGEWLDRVKAAASLIVEKLGENDIISVVSFSDRAEVVLPASHLSNKITLISRIRSITASGGTEIYQGLVAGLKEVSKAASAQRTSHLILLTDGHTYGDAEACLQLAETAVAQRIGISAFGIGAEWNDQFLDELVSPSGGQSGYIESPGEIIDYLQNRIQGLGAVYAQNLRLHLALPVGVRLKYAFKVAPFAQPLALDSDNLKLGAVEGRSPLSVLLELVIDPQLPGRTIEIPSTLLADIPMQRLQDQVLKHQYELMIVPDDPIMHPPQVIVEAVRALNFYRMNEQVLNEVEEGELEMATKRMRRLTTRLLEAGYSQLAQQAYAETEQLATIGSLSLEGRKKLKYGTRSLMIPTVNLDSHDNV